MSRPTRACEFKSAAARKPGRRLGHALHGRVSLNVSSKLTAYRLEGHALHGRVSLNFSALSRSRSSRGHALHGRVSLNFPYYFQPQRLQGSRPTRACEFKSVPPLCGFVFITSRPTRACEFKSSSTSSSVEHPSGHALHGRVSLNDFMPNG